LAVPWEDERLEGMAEGRLRAGRSQGERVTIDLDGPTGIGCGRVTRVARPGFYGILT